jgi:hypothetical protein
MRRRYVVTFGFAVAFAFTPYASARDGLPWSSGFETGDFREWNASRESKPGEVVSDGCYAGKFCSRTPLERKSINDYYVNHHFGDYATLGLKRVDELYLRFYVKFSERYTWPATRRDRIKIALINSSDGKSIKRRYQVYLFVGPDGRYGVDHSYMDSWRFFGLRQNHGSPAAVRRGQWDKIKLYVRQNTPGQSDGAVRLWVNDELKVDYDGLNLREHTSFGMNRLIMSSYTGDATGGDGYLYHDEWTLSHTDPDAAAN